MKKIILVIALTLSNPCLAQFRTGNDLFRSLETSNPSYERIFAMNYIMGAADTNSNHHFFNGLMNAKEKTTTYKFYCIPPAVTAGQLADIVQKYLKDKPESRHMSASLLINAALLPIWPCDDSPR